MTDPAYTDLADAILMLVFCLLTLLLHSVTTGFILCMFLSLAISLAAELPRKAYGKALVQMAWPILCLIIPEGWYFLPLLGFATARASLWLLYIPDALILLYRGKQAPAVSAFLMTGMVLAFALARKNALLAERTRKMHESRDDITARSKALAERNRELQRQQDAEIYAATLKERNRIAWQIHDNVGHILSRTILMVGALKTVNEDPKLTEPLDQIEHSLQTAMNSIRDSVRELHDDSIDLKAASTALLRGFTFCQAEFRYDMNVHAEPAVKYAFLAVLKEALDQIERQGSARLVMINMQEHPGMYQIVVQSDGGAYRSEGDRLHSRYDQNETDASARNITNRSASSEADRPDIGNVSDLEERFRQLGGTIFISHENGFRVFAMVPRAQKEIADASNQSSDFTNR